MFSKLIYKIKLKIIPIKDGALTFIENITPIFIIILFLYFVVFPPNNNSSNDEDFIQESNNTIEYNWEEIKEYINGTENIEACTDSGCYTLEADITNGQIEEIYFPNGGYLYFSADIDENGDANDTDNEGRDWDFSIDMNSDIVENAVDEWKDNQYNNNDNDPNY